MSDPQDTPCCAATGDAEWAMVLDTISDAFFALDRAWRFTYLNRPAERLLRRSRESLLGRNLWEEFPEAVGTAFERHYRRALADNTPVLFDEYYPPLDGWFEVRAYPSNRGLSVHFQEVTARRAAERTLDQALSESRRHQAEVSALLRASRSVLEIHEFPAAARAIFDQCKTLLGASAGYVALLSRDGQENEVLFLDAGRQRCEVDPSLPMPIRGLRERAYQSGEPVFDNSFAESGWAALLPPGHAPLENVLFAPLVIRGQTVGLLGLANKPGGFTERDLRLAAAFSELAAVALMNSRSLQSLEASEQHFRSVAQTAGDAIITADQTGTIVFWNQAAERVFGYTAQEALGAPLTMIMPERFREGHGPAMQRALEAGRLLRITGIIELAALTKDRGEIPVEMSLAAWKVGESAFFTSIIRDVSERKRFERELARSNAELEQFASIVSHDLRSPLMSLNGFVELLHRRIAAQVPAEAVELLSHARESANRMKALINSLLEYSRVGKGGIQLGECSAEAALKAALRDLRAVLDAADARVTHDPLPAVRADEPLLSEVFQNLIENAVKYRGECRPLIHVAASEVGGDFAFTVRDNGAGIPPEHIERVFQIFHRVQTDDSPEAGMGLGLAVCKRIIEKHGGRIWVESRPGAGSTFHFTLPRSVASARQPLVAHEGYPPAVG